MLVFRYGLRFLGVQMFVVMYLLSFLSVMVAFISLELGSITVPFISSIFAGLTFFAGYSSQNSRATEIDQKTSNHDVNKGEKFNKILQTTKAKPNEQSSLYNLNDEFISKNVTAVVGILNIQLSLLSHIENVEQNHFTIGYTFGLIDGFMQANNIDLDNDVSLKVLENVLVSSFSNKDSSEILKIYEKETKNPNSVMMIGIQTGGEDVFKLLKHNETCMGLCAYFDDDSANEPPADNDLKVRLEKLTELYKGKLITKKVYEEKQAELLSEL